MRESWLIAAPPPAKFATIWCGDLGREGRHALRGHAMRAGKDHDLAPCPAAAWRGPASAPARRRWFPAGRGCLAAWSACPAGARPHRPRHRCRQAVELQAARNSSKDLKDMDEKSPKRVNGKMAAATSRMVISPICCSAPIVSPVWPPICCQAKMRKPRRTRPRQSDCGDRAAEAERQQRRRGRAQRRQWRCRTTPVPAPAARPSARAGGSRCMKAGSSAREAACAAIRPQNT